MLLTEEWTYIPIPIPNHLSLSVQKPFYGQGHGDLWLQGVKNLFYMFTPKILCYGPFECFQILKEWLTIVDRLDLNKYLFVERWCPTLLLPLEELGRLAKGSFSNSQIWNAKNSQIWNGKHHRPDQQTLPRNVPDVLLHLKIYLFCHVSSQRGMLPGTSWSLLWRGWARVWEKKSGFLLSKVGKVIFNFFYFLKVIVKLWF